MSEIRDKVGKMYDETRGKTDEYLKGIKERGENLQSTVSVNYTNKNNIALVLQIIGGLTIASGLIVSFFIAEETEGIFGFAFFIACCITGVLYFGFAAIIELLEKNANYSAQIVSKLSSGKKDIDANQLPDL